jgi:hypothetical protein
LEGASPDAPKNFSAVQEHCPPENFCFTIRYSPFATRRRFTIRHSFRYSPFAAVFGSAGASPSHDVAD